MPEPASLAWDWRPSPASRWWIGALPMNAEAVRVVNPSAERPADPGIEQPAADALVLDVVGDGDRHLGDMPAGRLQAEMADDALGPVRPPRATTATNPSR